MMLGELLVCTGACTRLQLGENQARRGGRLGTNLLALRCLDEERLAAALGQQAHLPSLCGELRIDARARSLLTREQVERYEVVPYRFLERRLAVLLRDPGNVRSLDEVAFITGKSLLPFVVPEIRLWALMKAVYGIERAGRFGFTLPSELHVSAPDLASPSADDEEFQGDLLDSGNQPLVRSGH